MSEQQSIAVRYWEHLTQTNGEPAFVNNTDELFRMSGATSYPKFLKLIGPVTHRHPCDKCKDEIAIPVGSRSEMTRLVRRLRYAPPVCSACEEKRKAAMPKPQQMCDAYWKGTVNDEGTITWETANFPAYCIEHDLDFADDVAPHLGTCSVTASCGRCGKSGLRFSAATRSKLSDIAKRVIAEKRGRCPECTALDNADEEKQRLAQEQQEAEAHREKRRAAMKLKHGPLFLDTPCPEDGCEGWLVVRLNTTAMKPFASCSSFNAYRSGSCRYNQSIAPELREKYLDIFRSRLEKKVEAA